MKELIRALKTHKKRIASERDAIRDIQDKADELAEASVRADEALEEAIDALSEQV